MHVQNAPFLVYTKIPPIDRFWASSSGVVVHKAGAEVSYIPRGAGSDGEGEISVPEFVTDKILSRLNYDNSPILSFSC